MAEGTAGELPSEAMRFFKEPGFARVADAFLVLIFAPSLLTGTEIKVLLLLIRHANWSLESQGGIPATWVSAQGIADEARISLASAERALSRLGSVDYREFRQGGIAVHDRTPLCIVRRATADESAAVLEAYPARVGCPPAVRVFRHPRFWRVAAELREAAMARLAPRRKTASSPARERP